MRILKATDPKAKFATATDRETGVELSNIVEVDLDTGKAKCYALESNGVAVRVRTNSSGEPVIMDYDGLVDVKFDEESFRLWQDARVAEQHVKFDLIKTPYVPEPTDEENEATIRAALGPRETNPAAHDALDALMAEIHQLGY